MGRIATAVLLFLTLPAIALAQDQPTAGTSTATSAANATVSKDPQAVAVLQQTMLVTGWGAPPSDVLAQATLTSEREGSTQTSAVVLKARGQREFRNETADATFVKSGDRASVADRSGSKVVGDDSIRQLAPYYFPFFTLLTSYADADVELTYLGIEEVRGEKAYKVRLVRRSNSGGRPQPMTIFVSVATLLPLKLTYTRIASNNPNVAIECTRLLSDYRKVGWLWFPFYQEETVGGRPPRALRFESVRLNVGLSDSDFTF